jgi:thioredoxin-like negative regulator of GroEL
MQVYGLPSLVLFRDGQAVEGSKHEGAIAMSGIRSWLESYGISTG